MSGRNAQAEAHQGLLKEFFSDDPRFVFQKLVAHGNYGSASHIKYIDPRVPSVKDFLVKMAFNDEDARESMIKERKFLEKFRGNSHIVQLIDIPENPLEDELLAEDVNPNDWIIMEWIQCGTFGEFIYMARGTARRMLPNRLLWRFFLCLIRSVIAMAWADNNENINHDVPASELVHNDLHLNNVLLGEPPMDEEHRITPILKIIDFGVAGEWPISDGPNARQSNIYDIGSLMMALITLSPERPPSQDNYPTFTMGGREVKTEATRLVPCPDGVDPTLAALVCACMASDYKSRPTLTFLLDTTVTAVRERTAAYYQNIPDERDAYISRLWRDLTFTALT
ncbi:kinase-like protein [Hypoxylon cercidicola]|nr:kinase-like protein [Hypoxylon cercidicola]